ncbi:MAG: hypothetical protein IKC03_04885 [Oscillospiraceae bacterium]|nr:hypothetical protein [Oscillospiraceae bacterium]
MKQILSFVMALICALSLSACGSSNQEQTATYRFHGENEFFAISNGSIALSDSKEVFDGGNLYITQTGIFDHVASYSATFYTKKDGVQRTLMSNSVVDQTGGTIHVEGDLGIISGDGFIIGGKVASIDELKGNLWFELKTTDSEGKESSYHLRLTLTEAQNN